MKGISSLIATVLLIAFTVSVAGIISVWLTGFIRGSTQTVSEQAGSELVCSYGGISLTSLKYCGGGLSGRVDNTGNIVLGNITIQILYTNASSQKHYRNVTLDPREGHTFNVSCSSNYDTVRVITNCSSIYDTEESNKVSTSC
jgi:flagellin-like protein